MVSWPASERSTFLPLPFWGVRLGLDPAHDNPGRALFQHSQSYRPVRFFQRTTVVLWRMALNKKSSPTGAWTPAGARTANVAAKRVPFAPRPRQTSVSVAETMVSRLTRATSKPITTEVEKTSWTSRRLFASVSIQAPTQVVWGALTDYDGLGKFIPSLTENQCIQRKTNGAVLRQVGAQEVAMGVNFSAACVLDCTEYLQGVPLDRVSIDADESRLPFPRTTLTGAMCQDIAFEQLEGDFQAFRGIWRMQEHALGDSGRGTLLSYALYVQPKAWLPVGLIQNRIEKEVVRNLNAVRQYAEQLHQQQSLQLN